MKDGMRLFKTEEERLNELVFENRNKTYGAYAIRSDYSNTMLKAYVITFSSIALLLGSVVTYNYFTKKDPLIEIPPSGDFENTITVDMDLREMQQKPEPVQQTATAAPNTSMPTVISETAATTASVDIENPQAGQGDPTSRGSSPTSTLSSPIASTVVAEPEPYVPPVVDISETMPEYEGGVPGLMAYLRANLNYPELAKSIGREGTVHVTFIVDENAMVRDARILKGIGYGCDEEALRVIGKMPKWKSAGKNGNKIVRVRYNLPISFKLK